MRVALLFFMVMATAAEARAPKVNYMVHCQGCHLADGSGMAGKVPTMKDTVARFLSVPGGREFLVQVPGTSKARLSDADVAALLNWMIPTLDPTHMPGGFAPYTTEEIARLRAVNLSEVKATRDALMEAVDALP